MLDIKKYKEDFDKLGIYDEQEQLEIVKIFSSLFRKIQKEKDILSLYKKQKAYLLQNMFI